jgi:hypothetical protein
MEENEGDDSVDDQVETPDDRKSTRSGPTIYDIALKPSEVVLAEERPKDDKSKEYAAALLSIAKSVKQLTENVK